MLFRSFEGMISALGSQDENLVGWLNVTDVLYHSWWAVFAVFLAHVPLGMLPHIGNKLWALKEPTQRMQFIRLAFVFALILAMLGFGGIMARVILGEGIDSNQACALFSDIKLDTTSPVTETMRNADNSGHHGIRALKRQLNLADARPNNNGLTVLNLTRSHILWMHQERTTVFTTHESLAIV